MWWLDLDKTIDEKYGKFWQDESITSSFYENIFEKRPILHKDLQDFFFKKKDDIDSVLEIGCGKGIYPIKLQSLFEGKRYTGIDISRNVSRW